MAKSEEFEPRTLYFDWSDVRNERWNAQIVALSVLSKCGATD